jgi:hypothetical protein
LIQVLREGGCRLRRRPRFPPYFVTVTLVTIN